MDPTTPLIVKKNLQIIQDMEHTVCDQFKRKNLHLTYASTHMSTLSFVITTALQYMLVSVAHPNKLYIYVL